MDSDSESGNKNAFKLGRSESGCGRPCKAGPYLPKNFPGRAKVQK